MSNPIYDRQHYSRIRAYTRTDLFHITVKDNSGNVRAEWLWDGSPGVGNIAREILGIDAPMPAVERLANWLADNEEPLEKYEIAPNYHVTIHEVPRLAASLIY